MQSLRYPQMLQSSTTIDRVHTQDNNAGASECVGLIDPPDIKAKTGECKKRVQI